jgi:hypothetical protein
LALFCPEACIANLLRLLSLCLQLGSVAVFLEIDETVKDYPHLESYIRRWRRSEKEIVDNCAGRRLGAFTDPELHHQYADFDLEDEVEEWEGAPDDEDIDETARKLRQKRKFHPYDWLKEVETEYYFRYEGSQVVPPCMEQVHWRVMKESIKVPRRQIAWLEKLTARRVDPDTCQVNTAGRERSDGSGMVDVNRPIQLTTHRHKVVFCECIDWPSKKKADQKWCNLTMEERGVLPYSWKT